jgi:hypothetical protein
LGAQVPRRFGAAANGSYTEATTFRVDDGQLIVTLEDGLETTQ